MDGLVSPRLPLLPPPTSFGNLQKVLRTGPLPPARLVWSGGVRSFWGSISL
jgi:hypothetical protein